jgi:Fuc2NAc and GlcNAc transferase
VAVETYLAVIAAFALSFLLTFVVRRIALSRGMIDIPNRRSSHIAPTPRGGGVAIVIASVLASGVLLAAHAISFQFFAALVGGGLPVAVIGLLDDRKPLPASARLAVHLASATWAVYVLGGLPAIRFGATDVHLGIWGDVLAVFAIVWMLNLFNFMDGIDGIAASEAVSVAAAGAGLWWLSGNYSSDATAALTVAAACLGFLPWNWPPAKIFMGDVGSGYLGFVISVLALAASQRNPAGAWVWLILGGVFSVDATVTLVRRIARGDRVYEAHRTHAYQWLARRWKSHKRVTVTVTAINLLWLLPCAYFSVLNSRFAAWAALVALTPLVIAAIAAGAGRHEKG